MAHRKASVIVLIVLISFTCAQVEVDRKKTTTTTTTTETPIDPTTTSTETTTVSPTTEEPTTKSTSTSTVDPTTTTTSTTTTLPPSTTTVAPITTTVAPTPVPSPDYKKWSYNDKNQTCVIVQLAVQLNVSYANVDKKVTYVLYNVPVNETIVAAGSCGTDNQSITVQWGKVSQMMLQFTANSTAQQFMLSEIYLSINASDVFADAKANQTIELFHINNEFSTALSMSYHCNKIQTIGFTNTKDGKEIVANATIAHVQLEAFRKQNTDQFSTARDCEAIDTPDIVPIAVGCALAGLVVVVLIAYLVGRRRAQASGYLSM